MPAPAHSTATVAARGAARSVPHEKARRYYVDNQAQGSGTGDSLTPFRSIQEAAGAAGPGDTVLVRPGIYTGGERVVSVTRSGLPGALITFLSEHRWKAVVDGREGQSLEAWYFGSGVSYVRVEGFEIRNFYEHAFDTYGGGVHDLIIARNRVHHIGRHCTDTSNGRTGASLGAQPRIFKLPGNLWYHSGRRAPGAPGCPPTTRYYQNHDHGIYIADADDITIINNVFFRFSRGWAIHRYYSRGTSSRGLLIANNTFTGPNPYRPGQVILATPTSDLRVENNIFHAPQAAALYFENARFSGGVVRHNMVHGGAIRAGRPRGVAFTRNREDTDPKFAEGGVRLGADSPALDAGRSLPEVPHDADGIRRPQGSGYDLGAYERQ
jgi:hypothetical protein